MKIYELVQDTVGELHKKACEPFDLIPDEVAVLFWWFCFLASKEFFSLPLWPSLSGVHLGLLWSNKAYIDG